jgi:hypothetical protein
MHDEVTHGSRRCHDCREQAPAVATDFTLISTRYGWRLTRSLKNGETTLEWRCPRCWQRHRQTRAVG